MTTMTMTMAEPCSESTPAAVGDAEDTLEASSMRLTVVPLEALRTLLSEAQYVTQSPTTPSQNAISRLREAGKAFDDACWAHGYTGNSQSGRFLCDITTVLSNTISHQIAQGTHQHNPYTHGLINGMLMAQSIITNQDVDSVAPPEVWLDDELLARTGSVGMIQSSSPVPVVSAESDALALMAVEEDHY